MYKYYKRTIKNFISLRCSDRKLMILLFITSFLRIVTYLPVPYVASLIIDAATEGDYHMAYIYVGLFFLSAMIYVIAHHFNHRVYALNANFIHDELQRRMLGKVVNMDTSFAENISSETIVSTAYADITYAQRIPDYFFDFLNCIGGILITIVILIVVNPLIGIIVGVLGVISLLLFGYHMRRRDYFDSIQREHEDDIANLYSQVIDGYKEIHAFDMKDNLKTVLEHDKSLWHKNYNKKRIHQDLANAGVPIILGSSRLIIYLICAGLILSGQYNISLLVLVIGYLEDIQDNFDTATGMIYYISRCTVAIDRVHRVLNYRTPHMLDFGKNDNDDIKGEIEFKNVNFAYENQPSMRNVSFKIKPNSLTAIVGKSGSGKSTIFRLLLRFYRPTKGKILIDGVNIQDYTADVYATNVSIVTQKPFVFDMTIRQNLNLVDTNEEHQIEACKKAGIYDTIMKLPKGFDTPLVANASNISAGQRQLLALARTLLSKSEILLFDEVTSALDAKTSAKIVEVFSELKKDHTVLMITHKPELMQMADDIIVIHKGKLAARGHHRELIMTSEDYKTLQK